MTLPTNENLASRSRSGVPKHVEEAVKLTATFVNNIAVGITVTGGIAPVLGFVFGSLPPGTPFLIVTGVSAFCVIAGTSLHFAGRRYVRQELKG